MHVLRVWLLRALPVNAACLSVGVRLAVVITAATHLPQQQQQQQPSVRMYDCLLPVTAGFSVV